MSRRRVESIIVGDRRREDMGDLDGLAASIEKYGLLHPIVIDDDNRLVAGGRRLEACRRLGWEEIDVRSLGDLTDAQRGEIELEENINRKDLSDLERDRDLVREARKVAPLLASKLEGGAGRGKATRPERRTYEAPKAEVAQALSTSVGTLVRAEQRIAAVEAHKFMGGPNWKQYHVLEARERLEKLPEPERQVAANLIDQPAISPRKACEILGNLAQMPADDRTHVLTLSECADQDTRALALATAAKQPPMPDRRLTFLVAATEQLRLAVRELPADPFVPRLRDEIAHLASLGDDIHARHQTLVTDLIAGEPTR